MGMARHVISGLGFAYHYLMGGSILQQTAETSKLSNLNIAIIILQYITVMAVIVPMMFMP